MQDSNNKFKNLARCVLFFVILFVLLFGLSKILVTTLKNDESLVTNRNKNMLRITNEPENTIDVAVLGDSLSYSSFSPLQLWRDYGITAYICGQPGQRVSTTYSMLKTVFKTQSPKLIILEPHVFVRNLKGVDGIDEAVYEALYYNIPLFRYHDSWKSIIWGYRYVESSYKGFVIRDRVKSYSGDEEYMNETKDKKEISDMVLRYMEQFVKLCEENGAEILFVSAPSPKNYDYKTHNAIADFAKEHSINFLDMNLLNKELKMDWAKDSLDVGDHVNLNGACKITEYLGKYLDDMYDLPDHRNDEIADEWNEASDRFFEIVEKELEEMYE